MTDKAQKTVRIAKSHGWQIVKPYDNGILISNLDSGIHIRLPARVNPYNKWYLQAVAEEIQGFRQKMNKLKRQGNPFPHLAAMRYGRKVNL